MPFHFLKSSRTNNQLLSTHKFKKKTMKMTNIDNVFFKNKSCQNNITLFHGNIIGPIDREKLYCHITLL